ncbi:hypothetical protein SAMN05421736_102311 [Evansella caseinilytica]|uniref:Uncharacterized protein n=1 Tax=Evansella caseinilytica TaxID=1503961 RepID=A0A1H3KZF1_9BACI|nr:hypothetical protein [Evansella caseinilytica]SDY57543.1 hypothetical protein SAMN05421736_102311 [Evansella caseinilytica]
MNELYKQIHLYLNMDEEISFEEFDGYYKRAIDYFNEHADQFEEDAIWKALFISENVMSNADARSATEKGAKAKKYKKMAQRLSLWAQNFTGRLAQQGYSKDEMNQRFEEMFQDKVE